MSGTATGRAASPPLAPEDQARADFYALLARLYTRAPDAALLARAGRRRSAWPEPSDDALAAGVQPPGAMPAA